MSETELHDGAENEVGFDRDAFLELASTALTELRAEALKYQNSHELVELLMMDIWKFKASGKKHLLSILFDQFPELRDNFDIATSARKLYTLENLEELVDENGVNGVANSFFEYFAGRMYKRWHVLIGVESVEFGAYFPELITDDSFVTLRRLKKDEKELFRKFRVPEDRLNSLFFIAVTQAGDALKAVEKARANIRRFLVPYYLHRMPNPDGWWRARTQRNTISPVSFYFSDDKIGVRRELKQPKGQAKDLFLPKSPIDKEWKAAIQSLVSDWNNYDIDFSYLERSLHLCSRWMFAAETEEDIENAFVRHCVAWEALLPGKSLRRSWYLLLLSAGSGDRLCVTTVSQGKRFIDRRNKLVHPVTEGTLWNTKENDLLQLQQSLYYAFNNALRIMKGAKFLRTDCKWKKLLSLTFDGFIADDFPEATDKNVLALLDDSLLLNGSMLNDFGEMVRTEALCVKAQERWKKHRRESIEYLARAYQIATLQQLPLTALHIILWLKKYIKKMSEEEFKKAWSTSSVTIAAPSVRELDALIASYRDRGIRPEDVGWEN